MTDDIREVKGGLVRKGSGGGAASEYNQRPAVVVDASDHGFEQVIRTLIRAKRHDHFVFVVADEADDEVRSLTQEMGFTIVELGPREAEHTRLIVERFARSLGFPGLLYLTSSDERIDFSRCHDAVESATEYSIEAPTIERDVGERSTVVAAIPAYNEANSIAEVVGSARELVDHVIVVDDGSDDDTVRRAREAGATVIEHHRNMGYGAALKTAFREANHYRPDHLVLLDGDGQHEPADIPKLLSEQRRSGAEVVIGSRYRDDARSRIPLYRRFGLWVINVMTNLSLGIIRPGSWVSDTQSGFRVFSGEAVQSLATDDSIGDGMSASTDILYHTRIYRYDVREVGTTIRYDGENLSSQNPMLHGLGLVSNVLRTVERERPLTLLGVPGFVTTLAGLGFGYWTVLNYVNYSVLSTGLALLCLLCLFIGSLLSLAGVFLHSLNTHVEMLEKQSAWRVK